MKLKKVLTILASFVLIAILSVVTGVTKISSPKTENTDLLNPFIDSENIQKVVEVNTDSTDLKEYSNPFNTYSLRYPANWTAEEQKFFAENEVDLQAADLTLTKSVESPKLAHITVHDYNQKCTPDMMVGYGEINSNEIYLNKLKATEFTGNNNSQFMSDGSFLTVYVIQNTNTCIEISVWQDTNRSQQNSIMRILDTLILI